MPYNELVTKEIVDRLSLADTGPDLDPARTADYVVGYTSRLLEDRRAPVENVEAGALAPAGGFYSTATDLVTYFSAHFFGDDRLLSDESKREMQHSLWDTGDGRGLGLRYGLGLEVIKVGERDLIGHSGGWPGQITRSLADPRAKLAVSVLTNTAGGPAEALAIAGIQIIDLAGTRPRPEQSVDLTRYTGRFADPSNLWFILDVALLGGRLYALNQSRPDPAAAPVRLEVVDERRLRFAGGSGFFSGDPMSFTFAADGRIESVRGVAGVTLVPLDDIVLPARITLRDAIPGR